MHQKAERRLVCTTILFTLILILSFSLHSDSSMCTSTIYNIQLIRGTKQANEVYSKNGCACVCAHVWEVCPTYDTVARPCFVYMVGSQSVLTKQ